MSDFKDDAVKADESASPADTPGDGAGRVGGTMLDVRDEIRRAIISGELAPGSTISSVQLAQKYGVSRTPLREALRMLQQQGFVTIEPNQRPRVATFSTEELEAVFAQRILLGALCTTITVPQLTPTDVERMAELIADLARAEADDDHDRWRQIDDRFHRSHYALAPAALRADLLRLNERAQLFRYMWLGQRHSTMALAMDDHPAIYEACASGDGHRAATLVARHFATVAIALLARLDPTHEPIAVREALRIALYSND